MLKLLQLTAIFLKTKLHILRLQNLDSSVAVMLLQDWLSLSSNYLRRDVARNVSTEAFPLKTFYIPLCLLSFLEIVQSLFR